MTEQKRIAFFLPNIFTALNMACGFFSMLWAIENRYFEACLLLVLGGIFDSVDGRIARLTGTQSSFGEQFDSMSDLVSFGMAPGLLIYMMFLQDFGRLGMSLAFLFILCGALRLARFNANIDKVGSEFFQGLPIPGGAMGLIGFSFLSLQFEDYDYLFVWIAPFYVTVYSLLMISNIPFNSFKNSPWVRNNRKQSLFIVFILICLLFAQIRITLGFLMNFYVIASIIYFITHRKQFRGIFEWKSDQHS